MQKPTAFRPLRLLMPAMASVSVLMLSACDTAPDNPFDAALVASEAGDYQTARIMVRQALEADPANAAAIMLYGKTQLSLENPEGAAEEFKKLLDHQELGTEAGALLAKAYLQGGNSRLARETLAERGTNSGLAYAVAVVAELSDGKAREALSLLDTGLARFPDTPELMVLDAKRAFDQRDIARARGILDRVLDSRPNMIEARLLAGRLELNERRLDEASEHFDKVLASNPWNLPAILSQAAIARDKGDQKGAAGWIEKAKEISPNHPVGAYFAAQMAYEDGDIEQANMLVQAMGGTTGEFPAMRMLRGMIYAEMGQTHTAISELERFFRLGGDNDAARATLAGLYASTGADQKAWTVLEPALRSANAQAATLQLGASLAGKLGKGDQAALAARAQRASAELPYAKDLVAASRHIRAGKWEDADTAYQKALRAGGDKDPVVLNNAANIRLELGDKAGAVTLARKAFTLAPGDPVVMDTLGWSLIQTDPDSAEGRSLIQQAVSLAPGNKEIADHWVAISS